MDPKIPEGQNRTLDAVGILIAGVPQEDTTNCSSDIFQWPYTIPISLSGMQRRIMCKTDCVKDADLYYTACTQCVHAPRMRSSW